MSASRQLCSNFGSGAIRKIGGKYNISASGSGAAMMGWIARILMSRFTTRARGIGLAGERKLSLTRTRSYQIDYG